MKKTAKLIKKMPGKEEISQVIGIYEVSPAIDGHRKVVISAVDLTGLTGIAATFVNAVDALVGNSASTETYIFPSNKEETAVENYSELSGSQKRTMSHKKVLEDMGYEVTDALC